MSRPSRASIAISVALVLGALGPSACTATNSPGQAQPAPTSVPPAVAYVEPTGMWADMARDPVLASCHRQIAANAGHDDVSNVDELRAVLDSLGPIGRLAMADCANGA